MKKSELKKIIKEVINEINIKNVKEIPLGDWDNRESFLSKIKFVNHDKSIVGKYFYYPIEQNLKYKLIPVKVIEYSPFIPSSETNTWPKSPSITIELKNGKKISPRDTYSFKLYNFSDIKNALKKNIEKQSSKTKFDNSKKYVQDIYKKISKYKFKKEIEIDNTIWIIELYPSYSDFYITLSITATPKGKGNISWGNRLEITYLPYKVNEAKRHVGAFDRPAKENWFNSNVETIKWKKIYDDFKKALKLVKTKDETAYNKYFKK